jgi:hypothetical protein
MKEMWAFREYLSALRDPEEAFRSAGERLEFHLKLHEEGGRYVEILRQGRPVGLKFIEGDSPAQAIKDVAEQVPL